MIKSQISPPSSEEIARLHRIILNYQEIFGNLLTAGNRTEAITWLKEVEHNLPETLNLDPLPETEGPPTDIPEGTKVLHHFTEHLSITCPLIRDTWAIRQIQRRHGWTHHRRTFGDPHNLRVRFQAERYHDTTPIPTG